MDYATVDQLRQYLDSLPSQDGFVRATKEAEDTVNASATAWLARSTDIIKQYLQFSFDSYPAASARSIRASRTEYLFLPPHEKGSVTGVVIDGATVDPASYIVSGSDDGHREWLIRLPGAYVRNTWQGGRALVTAKWGYGPPPPAVVEVCLELAVNIYRGSQRALFADAIGVDGQGATVYSGMITRSMKSILDAVAASYSNVAL